MVDVKLMLVPAALHFGQERASSPGVVGVHVRVKVAAQTADYLGLVEDSLHRYTAKKRNSSSQHSLRLYQQLRTHTQDSSGILHDQTSLQAEDGISFLKSPDCI